MRANSSTSNSNSLQNALLFLRLLAVTLVFLVAIDALVTLGLKYLLYRVDDGRYYKMRYSLYENRSDILIIGSSIAEVSFSPAVFHDSLGGSCWNAGRGAQTEPYFAAMANHTLERYTPAIVIQTVQPTQLQSKMEYKGIGQLKPFCRFDVPLRKDLYPTNAIDRFFMNSSLVSGNSSSMYLLRPLFQKNKDGRNSDLGQKPVYHNYRGRTEFPPMWPYDNSPLIDEKMELYRKMISDYTSRGSKVVFVTCPYYYSYAINTATFDEFKKIATENPNVYYFNYWNDPRFIGNNELFGDVMHLNSTGALTISRMLAHDMKEEMFNACDASTNLSVSTPPGE